MNTSLTTQRKGLSYPVTDLVLALASQIHPKQFEFYTFDSKNIRTQIVYSIFQNWLISWFLPLVRHHKRHLRID